MVALYIQVPFVGVNAPHISYLRLIAELVGDGFIGDEAILVGRQVAELVDAAHVYLAGVAVGKHRAQVRAVV